jgi:restriction endonuclease Mrr
MALPITPTIPTAAEFARPSATISPEYRSDHNQAVALVPKPGTATPSMGSNSAELAAENAERQKNFQLYLDTFKTPAFDSKAWEQTVFRERYGTEASRRDQRRFNRYMKSEEGIQRRNLAERAYNDYQQSRNAARVGALVTEGTQAVVSQQAAAKAKAEEDARIAAEQKAEADRVAAQQELNQRIAGSSRFGDAFRLARQAGLENFTWRGKSYGTKYATEVGGQQVAQKPEEKVVAQQEVPIQPQEEVIQESPVTKEPEFNLQQFAQANGLTVGKQYGYDVVRWDPDGFGDFYIDSKGRIFHGGATFNNTKPYELTGGLGYGESKKHYEALQAAIAGVDNNTMQKGVKINVQPTTSSTSYSSTPAYKAVWKKNGGTMNRINYFQQGGAAPQQDIKAQVTALVQAAMQGDQKATQQVNQIMEAAKSGDQQAMQIAQIMEQVVKELQGQATAAKWGAKLGYIKSLKYAKGGKTCPACEAKKVEMKACGGKKAKKRYFGGLI